jgi:hypothetical protein
MRLRHHIDSLGCVTLAVIPALLCFAASNGAPATTESAFVADTWGEQVARAQKLAEAAEAAGEVAPHHLDEPPGEGETEEPAEPAEPKPAAAKPKPDDKAKAKPKDGEKPEGEEKNAGAVTPSERVAFREEKRKWREKRDQEQARFNAVLNEARTKFGPLEEAKALLDAGDPIGATEKLTGLKWNDLQKEAVKRVKGMDPRVEKLERELAAERERREKFEAERQAREQAAEEARVKSEWMTGLKTELGAAEDEIGALAQHPKLGFLEDVYAVQAREYDPDTGETLSAREAAEQVIENWRSLFEDLSEVFGDRPASKAEGSRNGAAHRKGSISAKPGERKPPTTLSQRKTAEASPPEPAEFDEKRWAQKFTKALREARD